VKLASEGTTLYLHGRDETRLDETVKLVVAKRAKAIKVIADLTRREDVNIVAEIIEQKSINALINNAGISVVKPVEELTYDDWQRVFAVNVTAPFMLTQALVRKNVPGSSIVNILSIASKTGYPNWSAYCMSKFGLDGFSMAVRQELRQRGIRVINIYPAGTNTDIWDDVGGDFDRQSMMDPDEVGEAVAFALERPDSVLIDDILLGNLSRMG
jgi:NAD(P)-dependent dehydrogenase (short-subunit alcohol dehydrogenase family)